jgi:hypothetical protein
MVEFGWMHVGQGEGEVGFGWTRLDQVGLAWTAGIFEFGFLIFD